MAIELCQKALTVYTKKEFPLDWAATQNNLALAYLYRIVGVRWENLEIAIKMCQKALTVYNPKQFPLEWAATQHNLASAYSKRIVGVRLDNIEMA